MNRDVSGTLQASSSRPLPSRANAGAALLTDDVSTAEAFGLAVSTGAGHTVHGPVSEPAYATPMLRWANACSFGNPVKNSSQLSVRFCQGAGFWTRCTPWMLPRVLATAQTTR